MVDESSFDNLVRELAASVQSRRALAAAIAGLGLSILSPLAGDSEAAPRRQTMRKRRRTRRDLRKSRRADRRSSSKGKGGKKGNGGRDDDNVIPEGCPVDPQTREPGFLCPDGSCSCGGTCCEKGYACFVEVTTPALEVCCFIDGNNSPLPEDAKLVSCPGPLFSDQTCCDSDLCLPDGTCAGLTLGRYRRNPR
jgi:hypothetical protein